MAVAVAAGFATISAPAFSQSSTEGPSRAVVQPLPPKSASDLSSALMRLSANALDGRAMLDAGWASLDLNDVTAAVGFFSRAENLPETAAEAKAGLGAAQVARKRPIEALALFDEAEKQGARLGARAADRGLAYDMVGDNLRAQQFYRAALAEGGLSDEKSQEITRQLALSQAISGDQAGSEATLLPLLKRQDLAAYRTRAFALAALGKTDEAVAIAEAVMPASLASRIAPYLRFMPKLTRSQQVSAGNFGNFPDADAIGKDDPQIAQYAAQAKLPQVAAALDARLTPTGTPLGDGKAKPAAPPAGAVVTLAKGDKPASKPAEVKAVAQPKPAPVETKPAVAAKVPAESKPPVTLARTEPAPAPTPAPAPAAFSAPTPAPAPFQAALPPVNRPEALPPAPASLADAFAEFAALPAKVAPAAGAVDITRIAIRREPDKKAEAEKAKAEAGKKAEAEKKKIEAEKKAEAKKKAANPSRVFVQVGTGQNRSAIAFTWRKLQKEQSKLFGSRKGYVAQWGRTNRLLTGPFGSTKEANAFVAKLKAEGIDCFVFTSDAGEQVDPVS